MPSCWNRGFPLSGGLVPKKKQPTRSRGLRRSANRLRILATRVPQLRSAGLVPAHGPRRRRRVAAACLTTHGGADSGVRVAAAASSPPPRRHRVAASRPRRLHVAAAASPRRRVAAVPRIGPAAPRRPCRVGACATATRRARECLTRRCGVVAPLRFASAVRWRRACRAAVKAARGCPEAARPDAASRSASRRREISLGLRLAPGTEGDTQPGSG